MPMVAELPIAMLACARLGAIHSVVFGGFSGKACGERMADAQSNVLVTTDADYRGGKLLNHKRKADTAVAEAAKAGQAVAKVLVWERFPGKYSSPTPLVAGRDHLINGILKAYYHQTLEPTPMLSEEPLFLMYTSGSTGRPKGAQHSTGGYLAYVTGTWGTRACGRITGRHSPKSTCAARRRRNRCISAAISAAGGVRVPGPRRKPPPRGRRALLLHTPQPRGRGASIRPDAQAKR